MFCRQRPNQQRHVRVGPRQAAHPATSPSSSASPASAADSGQARKPPPPLPDGTFRPTQKDVTFMCPDQCYRFAGDIGWVVFQRQQCCPKDEFVTRSQVFFFKKSPVGSARGPVDQNLNLRLLLPPPLLRVAKTSCWWFFFEGGRGRRLIKKLKFF